MSDSDTKPYRWCADCGILLGRTWYSFGTHTPLCEVCMDRRERASPQPSPANTWMHWIRTLMGW